MNKKGILNKLGKKRGVLLLLTIILCIGVVFVSSYITANPSQSYGITKVGDKAEWEHSSWGKISCPYEVNGFTAEINCNFTSYRQQTENFDGCFAFTEKIPKREAYTWLNFNHPKTVYDYGNIIHDYTCPTDSFTYTQNPNYAWCYADNSSVIFEHSFEGGNLENKFIWWNELEVVGSYQEDNYYEDWKDITSKFDYHYYESQLGSHWYCIKNISFNPQQSRLLKGKLSRNVGVNLPKLKYSVCLKRSSDTLSDAIGNNNFVCLDPWWDNIGLTVKGYDSDDTSFSGYKLTEDPTPFDEVGGWYNYTTTAPGIHEYTQDCRSRRKCEA